MTICQKITHDRYGKSGAKQFLCRMKKFLFRGLLATLGVSSPIAGLQQAVYATNPAMLSQPESHFSTLSGESLRGIENRNNSKDYSTIFSETQPQSQRKPILLSDNTDTPVIQVPVALLDLIKKVEINTGGSSLDSEQLVKVQYRMDSM
jgi:hypothetical protein